MSLKLIGAGFGRTGTSSLASAWEVLGLGRCYHAVELLKNPGHAGKWTRAAAGDVDWEELFAGYNATMDWPACNFWRELVALYPDARVVLSVRDPAAWYTSFSGTLLSEKNPLKAQFPDFFDAIVVKSVGGDVSNRERIIEAFEQHNDAVKRGVPKERLLVYEAKQGWEPLCEFLGVPVPDKPFPHLNTSENWKRL